MIARHTSRPTKSPSARGPIGWLAPSIIAWSISSAVATPSARIPIASFTIGIRILFTTNPGASATSTGLLPSDLVSSRIASFVSSEVVSPLMISTSFIIGTGLKKCIPIILSGLFVAAAISVMESDDVFVAIMVSGLHRASNSANNDFFCVISSVAASMIRSASATIAISVEPLILDITAAFSSAVIFSLTTSLSRFFSTVAIPESTDVCLLALKTTSKPFCARTWIIPAPIVPEPNTPIFFIFFLLKVYNNTNMLILYVKSQFFSITIRQIYNSRNVQFIRNPLQKTDPASSGSKACYILVFLPRQCFSHLFLILFHPWLVKRVHAHQISSYGAGCFEEVDQLAKVIGSQLRNIYLYHWNTNSFMSCHYAADCRLVDLVHAFTRKHLASTVRYYNILIRMKHI